MNHSGYTIPTQRVQAIAELAAGRGWDFDELVRMAGICVPADDGDVALNLVQVGMLFKKLLRETHDEMLGLGVTPVPTGTFRMLGYAVLGASDLRHAITRLQQCKVAVSGIPPMTLMSDGPVSTVSIELSSMHNPRELLIDAILICTHRMMAWATDSRIRLQRVEVPHPRRADDDDYDVLFGAPVVFAAPAPALVLATDDLDRPIVRREADWEEFLRKAPLALMVRRDYAATGVAARVRRIVNQGFAQECRPGVGIQQSPSADDIACQLAMSPATLRRRLREDGTSLSEIREAILRDCAISSLLGGEESVTALSRRLGFSEPTAFIRAFRRWTGSSPGTYRHRCQR
ncbi:MAG: hypothetical protein QOK02_1455 [Mycobacterium sp.]|jgi:AraC-like DNA-binding protein|nr:hypothetical protein [Mycobacterium sp.]